MAREGYQATIDNFMRAYLRGELQYREYLPFDGERLDTVVWEVYQNPWMIELIRRMNPHLRTVVTLTSGIPIRMPVIEIQGYTNINALPPWDPRRRKYLGLSN